MLVLLLDVRIDGREHSNDLIQSVQKVDHGIGDVRQMIQKQHATPQIGSVAQISGIHVSHELRCVEQRINLSERTRDVLQTVR